MARIEKTSAPIRRYRTSYASIIVDPSLCSNAGDCHVRFALCAKPAFKSVVMQKSAKAKHLGTSDASPASETAKFSRLQEQNRQLYERLPELQLIYDTAPVGRAFLTLDCRYVQINRRLTEICGISVAEHIGRSVRDTVPAVAEQVEKVVNAIVQTGEPITGIEVRGQQADKCNADHVWITNWHTMKKTEGEIVGFTVVSVYLHE